MLLSLWLLSLLRSNVEHMHSSSSLTGVQVHCVRQQVVDILGDLDVLVLSDCLHLLALLQPSANVVREELWLESVDNLGQEQMKESRALTL